MDFQLIVLFSLLVVCYASMNTRDALKGEFSHQVSIQIIFSRILPPRHYCSGSIIDYDWVLAAGHCAEFILTYNKTSNFVVKAGLLNLQIEDDSVQVRQIQSVHLYDKYLRTTDIEIPEYDLSLIKVKRPFKYNSYVGPIKLASTDLRSSDRGIIYGWSTVQTSQQCSVKPPTVMKTQVVNILTRAQCEYAFKMEMELYYNKLAVGYCDKNHVCSRRTPRDFSPFVYLVEAGWASGGKIVGVTEPRRVAATTLASRVADERNCILGTDVGYTIRFDDCTDETTKIKYLTEGILLREMMGDPLLMKYSVIMLDEVHERTMLTDIIMGLLKKILRKRKSLRLIVSSATVDAEELRAFFNGKSPLAKGRDGDTSTILSVEGRLYPIRAYHVAEPVADYVKAAVDTALRIHETEEPGDALVFLTGMDEVDRAVGLLREHAALVKEEQQSILPLPMYGSLPNNEQLKVFRRTPNDTRKIVVATNIAETSITIPNIVYVIDCGFVKLPWFDVEAQTNSLIIAPVSKASADQKAGRSGRVRSGKVYRLYTEEAYNGLIAATPPEMQRSDLAPAVLQLKALGIDNVLRFSFPSAPPSKSLLSALELLYALGAIGDDGELTNPAGLTMAEIPLDPVFAKCLIASGEMGCTDEITTILAMLQVQNVFVRPSSGQASIKARIAHRMFEVEEGDLLTLLNVYTAYEKYKTNSWCQKYFINAKGMKRATEIRTQMRKLIKKLKIPASSCLGNVQIILKCITSGLFPYAAYLHYSGVYRTVRGNRDLYIHPNSCLYTLEQPQWVLFGEILQTNKTYMRELTVVNPEWLMELAPHFYQRIAIDQT